ncbi:hypothetical protein CgunFtcFv8_009827 [Champsocephalus gunnari]|uniref:Calponin-homology (CH) domain-containing protein n=1 Tax=Champsocephalus gunnari TaxID=52237 RepID=A0AAN8C3P9_CHAGU|nr:hypothetical protein CgunFtcFv8_009827 [Champsocephalus gunnari]
MKEKSSFITLEIYTDWANHYLAKSGCQRLIKDLSQDVTDGVLLAQIIQIIANEKVQDINGSPRSQSQMVSVPLSQWLSIVNALCTLKCAAWLGSCGNKPAL